MPTENSAHSNRLYVDPQDARLDKVRKWLLRSGLSAALQFDDPRYFFQVETPAYWPASRQRQFAAELATLRKEFS